MQELELKVIGTDDVRKSLEKRVNDSLVEVLTFVQNSQKTLSTHTKQYVEMKDWQIEASRQFVLFGDDLKRMEQSLIEKLKDFNRASSKLEDKVDEVSERYVNIRREMLDER